MKLWIWTVLFLGGVGFFFYQLRIRCQLLFSGRKDDGRNYSKETFLLRTKNTFLYAFFQKKFFIGEQPSGILHIVIFWGFLVLSLQVITMFMRGWVPSFYFPFLHLNELGLPYDFVKEIFEFLVIVAVVISLLRWMFIKPTRLYGFLPAEKKIRDSSHVEAYLILLFIFCIMVTGLFYDASRFTLYQDDSSGLWQPFSAWISSYGFISTHGKMVGEVSWWLHNIIVLIFLNLLPRSKHFHILTAIPNVFLGKVEPKGHLPKRDFSGESPLFGRSKITDFTWKQVMDMFSCTECGRCSSFCPATATGKPLAPRQLLLNLRDELYQKQSNILNGSLVSNSDVVIGEGRAVSDEVLWSCVTCRACEEACPVNIEYVDKIVDMRQHLVQEVSRFPEELNRAFKGLETQSNPWGISSHERGQWASGFNVPLVSENQNVEYLYYVGCGGAFDANNKKVTQTFVQLLKEANVSFAILGTDEPCNGETARRLGNEYLFQTMAEVLKNRINQYGVKKIIVNCPHCFNTLKNEYPEFGGQWEVVHAAQLVGQLIREGKVKQRASFDKKVVYHDSCYYGRYNDIYDEPRNLLQSITGLNLSEVEPHCREKGVCCGAGGGRMWMEEKKGERVNFMRTEQALTKNPDVIATSCPYCKIMIGSAINEKGISEKVRVMDVMEIVSPNG